MTITSGMRFRSLRSWHDFLRMGRDFTIFYHGLFRGQRQLWKDPFAVFSTEWFAKRLNCKGGHCCASPGGVCQQSEAFELAL